MLNKFLVSGRIAKKIELRRTEAGRSVTQFSIACQRNFKNAHGEYDTDFFYITAWGSLAEYLAKYARVGDMATLECRLCINDYEVEGQRVFKTQIIAESCSELYSTKPKEEAQAPVGAKGVDGTANVNPFNYDSSKDQAQLRELEQESYKNPFTTSIDVADESLPF